MDKSLKKKWLGEAQELLDTYCSDCFLNQHFRKEHSPRYAQAFCIKQCTVGEQLKEYGKRLS